MGALDKLKNARASTVKTPVTLEIDAQEYLHKVTSQLIHGSSNGSLKRTDHTLVERPKQTTTEGFIVQSQSPLLCPKKTLTNSTQESLIPTYLRKKDNLRGSRIKIKGSLGTVVDDLSAQFVVEFDDGKTEFIFKKEKHTILEN